MRKISIALLNISLCFWMEAAAAEAAAVPYSKYPEENFQIISNFPGSTAFETAMLTWPKNGAGKSISFHLWNPENWGTYYLVKAFGLESFSPNKNSVVVVQEGVSRSNSNIYSETSHYLYNPDKTKMCIIHFKLDMQLPAGGSHSSIYAELIGCHDIYRPK